MKKIVFSFLGIICLCFLFSCDGLERFGQEKYSCSENNYNINQITIIWTNALKKAYLYKNGKEKTMKVISLNKKEIILTTNNLKFVINRKNIKVSAYIDNEVVFLNCNKEKFNI